MRDGVDESVMSADRALLILGMHRSGTSCLASLLAAAGARVPGAAIRNWDNPHGHFEATAAVRLNETVLAYSGGTWLRAPPSVRWRSEHAAARTELLHTIAGAPALIKDPRSLLTLPFWLEDRHAWCGIGIVRHPLAVARSWASWRGIDLAEGIACWLAHNQALLRAPTVAVLDFEAPREVFLAAVGGIIAAHPGLDADGDWRAAYVTERIHHDGIVEEDVPGLAAAIELYQALVGSTATTARGFPWAGLRAFTAAVDVGDIAGAVAIAQPLLAQAADASAILVACCAVAARSSTPIMVLDLLAAADTVPARLRCVLRGKALLAAGAYDEAIIALQAAADVDDPDAEAVLLLPDALRRAGRQQEAEARLRVAIAQALYPHTVLARLAMWQQEAGDAVTARTTLAEAIAAAPPHRRGRLRTRLAAWLRASGDSVGADNQVAQIATEDPQWAATRADVRPA